MGIVRRKTIPKNTGTIIQREKKDKITFEEMTSLSDEEKPELFIKINEYLRSGIKGKRVAFMIIALWQLGYLLKYSIS